MQIRGRYTSPQLVVKPVKRCLKYRSVIRHLIKPALPAYCFYMTQKISLALSGGGSRAIAFHLGCLRALHRHNLLKDVGTVSAVSGGSVIAAAYFRFGGDFETFEKRIVALLKNGLVNSVLSVAASPYGFWWIASELSFLMLWLAFGAGKLVSRFLYVCLKFANFDVPILSTWQVPFRRWVTLTKILERALDREIFDECQVSDLSIEGMKLILNTTELTTGSAFRFSTGSSGGWRFGELQNTVKAAHAVAASAAYPLLLAHLQNRYNFKRKDGSDHQSLVSLTDGGVYDNLGVGPFWPDRTADVSLDTGQHRTIICCSAGYGLRTSNHPTYLVGRMTQVFRTALDRSQNAAIKRLYELTAAGAFETFIFPYLGMLDENLPEKPEGLVPREEVHAYPTNFSKMSEEKIARIALRGEQLTDCLLNLYGEKLQFNR